MVLWGKHKRFGGLESESIIATPPKSMEISRILKWRYLPYIRPNFQGYVREYTPKIWPTIWYSTSILGSWKSH